MFDALFGLVLKFGNELCRKELGQDILDERKEANLKDLHLLDLFLFKIGKNDFILYVDISIFFAPNNALFYFVYVYFSFIHWQSL